MEGGVTVEDSVIACRKFEKAGVDLLDISGGFCVYQNPNNKEQGYFSELSELSEAIKKEVKIPVILTGGIIEGKVAEQLLMDKKTDMIGVGRAILKDSQWASEVMQSL